MMPILRTPLWRTARTTPGVCFPSFCKHAYVLTVIGILYNLYGDKVLNLGLVPQSVYDMQSAFYPTVNNQYGVPLDTRHTYTKGMSAPRSSHAMY